MAKKALTWQQAAAQRIAQQREESQKQLKAEIAERLRAAEEAKRLYLEQEAARVAALTSEQKETEETARKEREEANRQIEIRTHELRHREITNRVPHIIHLQDEE
jgi:hypothetical protein